jgi:hypothetical protein
VPKKQKACNLEGPCGLAAAPLCDPEEKPHSQNDSYGNTRNDLESHRLLV